MARPPEVGTEKRTSGPMTPTLYVLIVVALVLSVAHHVDHVLRGDTGWPLAGGFNAFSASLVIYPLILTGLILSVLGKVAPRFWAMLSLGGGSSSLPSTSVRWPPTPSPAFPHSMRRPWLAAWRWSCWWR